MRLAILSWRQVAITGLATTINPRNGAPDMENYDEYRAGEVAPAGIPAATVVIFRNGREGGPAELLMLERSAQMRFAAGAVVFPGGRIDPADRELAASLDIGLDPEDAAARIAGIRETLEEAGLVLGIVEPVTAEQASEAREFLLEQGALGPVLQRFGWTLALDRMVPFARWLPRNRHIKIFDTRFYLYDIGTGAVDITVDDTENRHLFWASASEVLRRADAGELHVIYPTRRNLERLAAYPTFAECRAHAEATPVVTVTPYIEQRGGMPWLIVPPEAGYPIDGEPVDLTRRS